MTRAGPRTVAALEELGRVRLSKSFFVRDFLFSDIAATHGFANVPNDPDLAIAAGTKLCEKLLEANHGGSHAAEWAGILPETR